MTIPATPDASFGFAPGDHVCAFYSGGRNLLGDIVVDYITSGLEAGNQVVCMVDEPSAVRGRIPPALVARDGMLRVLSEDEAYMPGGRFSRAAFIAAMEALVRSAAEDGYGSLRAVGDESFLVRHAVDIDEWFAAEAQLNDIGGDAPHFFFCLYDLDLFDGEAVMRVLRTHPRVYVNGILIGNPHYQAA